MKLKKKKRKKLPISEKKIKRLLSEIQNKPKYRSPKKKDFHEFLRKRGIRVAFDVNVWLLGRNRFNILYQQKPQYWLFDCFIWEDTSEGVEFWLKVHNEWYWIVKAGFPFK